MLWWLIDYMMSKERGEQKRKRKKKALELHSILQRTCLLETKNFVRKYKFSSQKQHNTNSKKFKAPFQAHRSNKIYAHSNDIGIFWDDPFDW